MSGEIKTIKNQNLDPSQLNVIPSPRYLSLITKEKSNYQLEGFCLPPNRRKIVELLDEKSKARYCRILESTTAKTDLDWTLSLNEEIGLITEIQFKQNGHNSRVFLENNPNNHEAFYRGEDVTNIRHIVPYQEILARYLSYISTDLSSYAYISKEDNWCGSIDLAIPREFLNHIDPVSTSQEYQDNFARTAITIANDFDQKIRRLTFDDNGILTWVTLDHYDFARSYGLNESSATYDSHNVDSISTATAAHGIVATFINDMIRRQS